MIGVLKGGSPTSQTFWGVDESDTGGVLGVLIDSVLHTGETLSASNDYTGIVAVSGISTGTHTWEMALDGAGDGNEYTFQTLPAEGEAFKFVHVADATGDCQGFSAVAGENARFGVTNGDHYYLDVAPNFTDRCACGTLPAGTDAVVFATVLETYRCKHRCHLSHGMLRPLAFRQHQWVFNWHNHEFEVQPFITTTIADNAGIKYLAAKQAADEYMFAGNPAGPTNYDNYPDPIVYRDYVVGDCHFIHFDHSSYSFVDTAISLFEGNVPDGSGGENVGNKQLEWAAATISASTSKFIFLMSPAEPVHTGASSVGGGQWDTLFAAIDAKDATIVLMCGDTHGMMAELIGGTKLPNRPMLACNMSPLEHPLRSTSTTAWLSNNDATLYTIDQTQPTGNIDSPDTDYNYNYGTIDVNPAGTSKHQKSHIEIKIKNALTGATRWSCIVDEGERVPILNSADISGAPR